MVTTAAAVADAVKDFGPVKVRLGKTDFFPASGASGQDVLYVAVEGEGLAKLHSLLKSRFPNKDTRPKYTPHVTVCYLRQGLGKKYAGNDFLAGKEVVLTHLTFSGIDGKSVDLPLVPPTELPDEQSKAGAPPKDGAGPKPSEPKDTTPPTKPAPATPPDTASQGSKYPEGGEHDPQQTAEVMADILYGLLGDDVVNSALGSGRLQESVESCLLEAWDEGLHPRCPAGGLPNEKGEQGCKPGTFITKGSVAAVRMASASIDKVKGGDKSEHTVVALRDNLANMTVPQLRQSLAQLRSEWGGEKGTFPTLKGRKREDFVNAIKLSLPKDLPKGEHSGEPQESPPAAKTLAAAQAPPVKAEAPAVPQPEESPPQPEPVERTPEPKPTESDAVQQEKMPPAKSEETPKPAMPAESDPAKLKEQYLDALYATTEKGLPLEEKAARKARSDSLHDQWRAAEEEHGLAARKKVATKSGKVPSAKADKPVLPEERPEAVKTKTENPPSIAAAQPPEPKAEAALPVESPIGVKGSAEPVSKQQLQKLLSDHADAKFRLESLAKKPRESGKSFAVRREEAEKAVNAAKAAVDVAKTNRVKEEPAKSDKSPSKALDRVIKDSAGLPPSEAISHMAGVDTTVLDRLYNSGDAKRAGIGHNEYLRSVESAWKGWQGGIKSAGDRDHLSKSLDNQRERITSELIPGLRKLASEGITGEDASGNSIDLNYAADFYGTHGLALIDRMKGEAGIKVAEPEAKEPLPAENPAQKSGNAVDSERERLSAVLTRSEGQLSEAEREFKASFPSGKRPEGKSGQGYDDRLRQVEQARKSVGELREKLGAAAEGKAVEQPTPKNQGAREKLLKMNAEKVAAKKFDSERDAGILAQAFADLEKGARTKGGPHTLKSLRDRVGWEPGRFEAAFREAQRQQFLGAAGFESGATAEELAGGMADPDGPEGSKIGRVNMKRAGLEHVRKHGPLPPKRVKESVEEEEIDSTVDAEVLP